MTATWNLDQRQFWLHGQHPAEPVSFDEAAGLWNVHGHREAVHALSDPTTFSSNIGELIPEETPFADGNLMQMDPPDHSKLRKLVSRAFTPKVVADLEPRIRALTHELLDGVTGDRWELVEDLAYPLPVIVIAELLGVPSSDRHLFRRWVAGMLQQSQEFSFAEPTAEREREAEAALGQLRQLTDYLGEHAAERRKQPRADLLSELVCAEVDGQRLRDAEVVNFANLLLIAGHITTTLLLGNTVLCLDAHPQARAAALADRAKVPGAVEESLRFLSPFATLARRTTCETSLGERTIPAGQLLMVWIAAANRDPARFAEPDAFDIGRDPNPHLAFGRGVHFCIGAPLARLEGRVALNVLFDRFPGLRTDPDDPPTFHPNPYMTGVSALPLLNS